MVEILAELFKEATAEEIGQIAFLMQGRVAPLFEPVEFGMADKMVIKAIALAYETEGEKVLAAFKKTGDFGEVAETLRTKANDQRFKNLTVSEVFEKLVEITKTGGEGSVDKKIGILAELLKNSDSMSTRFLARIPVDKLRLGFSDMTILEGLSWMLDGTKKNKAVIEAAYNIRPDLGFIAERVKAKGVKGVDDVKPKVGTPVLVMRAERLTSPQEIIEEIGPSSVKIRGVKTIAVEPKLDGLRTQLHFRKTDHACETRLYSRGLENVTAMYPDMVAAAQKEIKCSDVILDGEAIGFDRKTGKYLQFQETVQRKRKYDVEEFSKNIPLKLVVFDCLYFEGESLIDKPYEQRRKILEKLLGWDDEKQLERSEKIIVPAEVHQVETAEQVEKYFQEYLKRGLEGIMAKKMDGVYQAGARGWNWIKLKGSYTGKLADTVDAVVMGIDLGQGKRNAFGVGAFLIGIYDAKTDRYKTISKVGTGLTDDEWRELKVQSEKLKVLEKPKNYEVNKIMECDVWLKPKLVGEFRADELTKSPMHTAGWALRFPRLVQWREKNPEDSTSLKEIQEMVALQKK